MRHVFIMNPVSGKKNAARELVPEILKTAESLGVVPEIEITTAPRDATELARRHAGREGAVRLYAVGGDGTLNEVFAGAWQSPNAEVACIPCGSGNDFVRSFGVASDFRAVAAQMQGKAVPVDLVDTGDGVCAAILSAGLDAEVAYQIPRYRRIPLLGGTMAYNISIVENLMKPLGKELVVVVDGQEQRGSFLIAAVCNARHYGGGFNAAPVAKLDDGLLDVILVKKVSRLLIASIIGKYKHGRHFQNGKIAPELAALITHQQARQVEIHQADNQPMVVNTDGECAPKQHITAKVMPQAARFVLPAGLVLKDAAVSGSL